MRFAARFFGSDERCAEHFQAREHFARERGHMRHGHGHGGRGGPGGPRGRGDVQDEMGMKFKRMLGHGDLRYVLLALLEKQPSHGYELIKAMETESAGTYVPSPGVIYPTLTFLQEAGYASVTSEGGKNLYTITDEGRAVLDEKRPYIDEVFARMKLFAERMSKAEEWVGRGDEGRGRGFGRGRGPEFKGLRDAFHALRSVMGEKMPVSEEDQKTIADILMKAIEEIRQVGLKK